MHKSHAAAKALFRLKIMFCDLIFYVFFQFSIFLIFSNSLSVYFLFVLLVKFKSY